MVLKGSNEDFVVAVEKLSSLCSFKYKQKTRFPQAVSSILSRNLKSL
jgi:hypothetical protein